MTIISQIKECSEKVSLKAVCEQMGRTPEWIPGLVLRADEYECGFYKKRIRFSMHKKHHSLCIGLHRLGSSGFLASDGINQVLPLSTAPLIRPSLQSLETRLLVIFHISAISDVVRYSMNYPLKTHYLSLSVFLRRNIFNKLNMLL